jgi:arylsulfatase
MARRPSVTALVVVVAVAVLLTRGAACGGAPSILTDEVLDLYPFATSGTEAWQTQRVRLMAEAKTHRLAFAGVGEELTFAGLALPPNVRVTGHVQLLEMPSRSRHPLEVRVVATSGESVAYAILPLKARLEEGQSWIPFEVEVEAPGPVEALSLKFDRADAEGGRVAVLRPVARFETERTLDDRPRRQVLLVTTDTLRADALGCYGNEEVRTPNLDRLAGEGLRFTRAFATANVTNPSHTSIFTSLYLKDHKVTDNFRKLAPEVPTMLEPLRAAGLTTAGFVSSFNFQPEKSDFDRRFDEFFPCETYFERRAEDVNLDALPWLGEHANEDFFVWLHYFDAHMPYAPPYPWDRLYPRDDRTRIDRPIEYKGNPKWFSSSELGFYRSQYHGEVTYLDHHLGELFDRLRRLGIYERATIVVVADHGEALGEHGVFCEHSSLFDEVTRVPLIIKPPASRAHLIADTDAFVSTVDLYPSIFELCDLAVPPGLRGTSVFGRGPERVSVFSTAARGAQETVRTAEHRFLRGVSTEELFPGFAIRAGERELYRIDSEGREAVDGLHERADALEDELDAFLSDARDHEALPIDAAHAAEMEKLGYTQGGE